LCLATVNEQYSAIETGQEGGLMSKLEFRGCQEGGIALRKQIEPRKSELRSPRGRGKEKLS
jgi:hypothetical protein